jgi:hypothetical protein
MAPMTIVQAWLKESKRDDLIKECPLPLLLEDIK